MRLALAFLAAAWLSFAHAATPPVERSFLAQVWVSPAGTVERVEPQPDLPPFIDAMVREAAGAVVFEPATVDGVPAASRTSLQVGLRFETREDGGVAASVVSVGPAPPRIAPPAYPREAFRDGVSARVVLKLAVDGDGRVRRADSRVESVQLWPASTGRRARALEAQMAEAALQAASGWQAHVEEVAGQPLATEWVVPVTFCAGTGPCAELHREAMSSPRQATASGVALARLQPAARPDDDA